MKRLIYWRRNLKSAQGLFAAYRHEERMAYHYWCHGYPFGGARRKLSTEQIARLAMVWPYG